MRPSRAAIVVIAAMAVSACSGSASSISANRSDSIDPNDSARTGPDTTSAGTDTGTDGSGTGTDGSGNYEITDWKDFGEGVEVGSIEVPIDYDQPNSGTFDLYVARHLATDPDRRIGSLLVNPGGPGVPGSDFAIYAEQIYSEDLLARFDIVGWDPRGTGLTVPAIDCIDDYDRFYAEPDITPDDDAETQLLVDLAVEFQGACADTNSDIIDHIGTNDSARDIDAIRQALGEAKISYFGFSYGSELGATWVTLFPDTVRAAVLDGAVDPEADFETSSIDQTLGFEATLATFLKQCTAKGCAFNGDRDAGAAYDELMGQLDDEPAPTETDRPPANRLVALNATAEAMYSEQLWPQLDQALADARLGDGSGLLALHDQYFQRQPDGTYADTLEAFQSISCMDRVERPSVEEDDAFAIKLHQLAPRLAAGTSGSYFCSFYPPTSDPRVKVTGAGAGPVLVVGTTGDPATPLDSTRAMAAALDGGVLLTVVADQHTGYGVNQCSYDVIDGYLMDLAVPAEGTRCE